MKLEEAKKLYNEFKNRPEIVELVLSKFSKKDLGIEVNIMNKKNLEFMNPFHRTITFHRDSPKNEIVIEIDRSWADRVSFRLDKEQIQQLIDLLQGQLTTNDKNKL